MSLQSIESVPLPARGQSVTKTWLRALEMTASIEQHPSRTLPTLIDDLAETFGEASALLSDRETLTYRTLADRSNRYARWAMDHGLGRGDVVGLFMPNCPEYMAIWLGITRIGAAVALLNANLTGSSLAHAIAVAGPKSVIVTAELLDGYHGAVDCLSTRPELWAHGGSVNSAPRLDREIESYSGTLLAPSERRQVLLSDRALCIYTSGTTGLPKAANVSHRRVMTWSHWFAGMMDASPGDRLYNALPMCHSIGGVAAPAALLVAGGSVLLRERFSASRFWKEVVEWDCTLFQYIGELCRYLVNTPADAFECQHRIRLACGNGLRPDVWKVFQDRFRIPQILEFYAATENNFSLFNVEGEPGAIGRIPSFITHRSPVMLIKCDVETGEPIRNAQGYCIPCAANEAGEAIGRLSTDGSGPSTQFEGYTSQSESERKVIHDVFTKGDVWLRTGDLMRRDEKGYYYFVDRLGDTFRWKGENVSTSEVAEVVCRCPGVLDACVYGVNVPRSEGRAGMAALVVGPDFRLDQLQEVLADCLPDYAQPKFLRIVRELSTTETFKKKSNELVRESYDPHAIADPLYVRDSASGAFEPLDLAVFRQIQAGQCRL